MRAQIVVGRVAQHVARRGLFARVAPLFPFGHRERQRRVAHRGDNIDERHFGDCRCKQIGAHVDARSNKQAACASPAQRDSARGRPTGCDKVLAARNGVAKGVDLREQLSVEVPTTTKFASAAWVYDSEGPAAIDERQASHREPRWKADLV